MIELDRSNIIKAAGANPLGEASGLVWFTDVRTGTTLCLKPEEVTLQSVKKRLRESRKKFNAKSDDANRA